MSESSMQTDPTAAHLRMMSALGSALKEISWRSAKGLTYLASAAVIVHVAGIDTLNQLGLPDSVIATLVGLTTSPVINRLIDSIGGDLLAGIITQVANKDSLSDQQILELLENNIRINTDEIQNCLREVIEEEKLLREEDFYRVVARWQRDQQEQTALLRAIHTQVIKGSSESPSVTLLTNYIDQLAERVSDEVEQHLFTIREAWRHGERNRALEQLQELMSDDVRWGALTQETKARFLCFKGSAVLILTGDIESAGYFAAELINCFLLVMKLDFEP